MFNSPIPEEKEPKISPLLMLIMALTFLDAIDFLKEEGCLLQMSDEQQRELYQRFLLAQELRLKRRQKEREEQEFKNAANPQRDLAILELRKHDKP